MIVACVVNILAAVAANLFPVGDFGLKGSDPSVYVLLYMLDFGAADVVACAAS